MSHLHLTVKCLARWQDVCTASTESKSKKTWWEWCKLIYNVQYGMEYMHIGGLFVTLEECLGRNDTSIISGSLSMLASYKSKNLILHWIAYHTCSWTWILGQEIPVSEGCSCALNTQAMSPYLTLWVQIWGSPELQWYASTSYTFGTHKWAHFSESDTVTRDKSTPRYTQLELSVPSIRLSCLTIRLDNDLINGLIAGSLRSLTQAQQIITLE